MQTKQRDHKINTQVKTESEDKQKRLPHERDESVDSPATTTGPRDIIQQAANDLERGLVDTDLRGATREVEKVPEEPAPTRKSNC